MSGVNMYKKILVCLLSVILVSLPIPALAESPNYNKEPELTMKYTIIFEYNGEKMIMDPWPETTTFNVPERIIHVGKINSDTYTKIDQATKEMLINNKKKITFDFNSPGGDTDAMSIIMMQMDSLKLKGIELTTQVTKNHSCMSACTLIYLKGDKRLASHQSIFMIHSPYWANASDKEPEAKKVFIELQLNYLRGLFINGFIKTCGEKTPLITNITDKKDHFYISRKLQESCPAYITDLTDGSLVKSSGF